jgi:lipopolysaccharide transport system ATP-binding protein
MHLYGIGGECIFNSASPANRLAKGLYHAACRIPGNLLNDGVYSVSMMIVKDRSIPLFNFNEAVVFDVLDDRTDAVWFGKRPGAVRPLLEWKLLSSETAPS